MSLADCPDCGKPVRLRGNRITINRRHGVAHWIEHLDGTPMHDPEWSCAMLKPYPKVEADRPWRKLMAAWNAAAGEAPL